MRRQSIPISQIGHNMATVLPLLSVQLSTLLLERLISSLVALDQDQSCKDGCF